ncbi:hypothetical protein [Cellulosimicrobium sp. NPDC057127]|uniref:hypothetical protein n=1 Tax=Cellulosimicrobium sp. NPDC057127 TaxID=3346026 RepID=UPI003642B972
MTVTAPDALEVARAALRRAELRTGVRTVAPPVVDIDVEDKPRPLGALLDDGVLPAGAVSVVSGSTSLLLALLAMSQGSAQWVAFVGMPDLGLLAAADAGLDLDRVAVVPRVGAEAATVVAALLDGFSYVAVGPGLALAPSDRRRLLARARERDASLVSTHPWEQPALPTAAGATCAAASARSLAPHGVILVVGLAAGLTAGLIAAAVTVVVATDSTYGRETVRITWNPVLADLELARRRAPHLLAWDVLARSCHASVIDLRASRKRLHREVARQGPGAVDALMRAA